jgi:ankyrin repeat protein
MTFDAAHRAIKRGDVEKLHAAVKSGLDPDLSNQYGWTLLMLAAMRGNTSIGELLIEAGAGVDHRNKFRDTALSLAVHTGHPSFVKLLLSAGASFDCHPHGNSLDIFFDWVAQYGNGSGGQSQIERIRKIFNDERIAREKATQ